jgi:hypothetical protein
MAGLRAFASDGQLALLRLLADRRRALGEDHTRMVAQLHQLLLQLIPGGAKKSLSAAQAKTLLASVRPRDVAGKARRRVAAELVADLERIYQRKKTADKELAALVRQSGTSLMDLTGIGPFGAARLLAGVRDIARFPARRTSRPGTAPPAGGLLRGPGPAPALPRWEPADKPRRAHHGHRPAAQPDQRAGLLRPPHQRGQDLDGSHARPQAAPIRRDLPHHAQRRRHRRRDGPGRTRGDGCWLQRGRLAPQHRHFGEVTSRTRHQPPYAPLDMNAGVQVAVE